MPRDIPPRYGHRNPQVLYYLYWERLLPMSEMSDILDARPRAIRRYMNLYDIRIREPAEAKTLDDADDGSKWQSINHRLRSDEVYDPPEISTK